MFTSVKFCLARIQVLKTDHSINESLMRKSSVSGILDWKVSSKTTVCTEKKPSPFLSKSMGSMGPREWDLGLVFY